METEWLSSKELTNLAAPAYGETWEGVLTYFRATPHEWARVEALMGELQARGQEEPGRLTFDEEEECYLLANGTHRWAACHLLGRDFLVAIDEDTPEDGESYSLAQVVIDYTRTDEEHLEALEDCISSSLSFRLTGDLWVELVGSTSRRTGLGVQLELSFTDVAWELTEALGVEVLKRLRCCMDLDAVEYVDVSLVRSLGENVLKAIDKAKP